MPEETKEQINAAWEAGTAAARALKPGDHFTGAVPAAKAAGYEEGCLSRMFVTSFVAALDVKFPNGVRTNDIGVIVS